MAGREQALRNFGYRISSRRCLLGMSQEKLAELCDLSTNAIRNLESGLSEAKSLTLMRLCSALRCSSDFLLFGDDIATEITYANQMMSMLKEAQGKLDDRKLIILLKQTSTLISSLATL